MEIFGTATDEDSTLLSTKSVFLTEIPYWKVGPQPDLEKANEAIGTLRDYAMDPESGLNLEARTALLMALLETQKMQKQQQERELVKRELQERERQRRSEQGG